MTKEVLFDRRDTFTFSLMIILCDLHVILHVAWGQPIHLAIQWAFLRVFVIRKDASTQLNTILKSVICCDCQAHK